MKGSFNVLLDPLPSTFDGGEVRTDYRQALKFFRIVESSNMDAEEKSVLILRCLFERLPRHSDQLWTFVQWYISGGEVGKDATPGEKVLDFEQDAGRIHAAFLQVYGIDLRTTDMHWWLFLSLFRSLPAEGTDLARAIEIRSKKIEKGMDKKTARALRKAKAAYALCGETARRKDFKGFLRG